MYCVLICTPMYKYYMYYVPNVLLMIFVIFHFLNCKTNRITEIHSKLIDKIKNKAERSLKTTLNIAVCLCQNSSYLHTMFVAEYFVGLV